MNYYRITAYYKDEDFSFIVDSNGMFEKLWQFSAYLVEKNIDIIEVSKEENLLDVNITPAEEDNEHFILRAIADGKPEYINQVINGTTYKAIKVGDKIYIPNKEEII
ncbi:MAG: hypothetical protein IKQ31_03035 [Clostridia bacterium]|nr:hypothetical protein [Clostridia bacterium]